MSLLPTERGFRGPDTNRNEGPKSTKRLLPADITPKETADGLLTRCAA